MSKRKGFTLMELLVVIAIIALLMAILMPALTKVRKQAKDVACQAQLKQWGAIFYAYAMDNEGYFGPNTSPPKSKRQHKWPNWLRKYFKEPKLMLCPRANSKFWNSPGGVEERPSEQSAFVAWGPWQPKPPDRDAWTLYEACGSYGTNSWLYNTVESQNRFWRNINVPQPATIPMFGDCTHIGAQPTENDDPPMFDGQWIDRPGQSPGGLGNSMVRFVLNRHGVGEANCTFFDLGVKVVGVKEWWRFKWSRVYDVRGQWTAEFYGGDPTRIPWPNWMKRYRDYP